MKTNFFIFAEVVLCVLFSMNVFGKSVVDVATWQDSRRIVSDAEWARPPFNKFVRLKVDLNDYYEDICTAQYIAPNIILSAGHCVTKNAVYTIDRADVKDIPVTLLEYVNQDNRYSVISDWALFLINDSKYYQQDVFNVSVPNYEKDNIPVMHAGWGGIRILTATDLAEIRNTARDSSNFAQVWNKEYVRKYEDHKLKTQECKILGKQTNSNIYSYDAQGQLYAQFLLAYGNKIRSVTSEVGDNMFLVDCITNPGNSGGGVVKGTDLYGVIASGFAGGLDLLFKTGSASFVSNSKQFIDRVNVLKQKYPATISKAQNPVSTTGSESETPKSTEPQVQHNIKTEADTSSVKAEQQQPVTIDMSRNSVPNNPVPQTLPITTVEPETLKTLELQIPDNILTQTTTSDATALESVIEKVEEEKNTVCGNAEQNFSRIKDMSDAELANFVAKAVYCKEREETLEKLQRAYDEAKAKEQSLENRTLTALTTAATGIGTMELLQGLAEQSADKDAMADMAAYIQTMRCTYGNGQQVKAGPEEIELPGANDTELMNLRGQYMSLAADLKERKEALGMKPGIESEVIMDRTQTGLYDDENIGITGGNYASIYRAMMLNSEVDQAKIDDAKNTSGNRVKYGATAAGAGVAGGIVGNELINGKLGDLLKGKDSEEK